MMDFELPRVKYPKGLWTREFGERIGQQKRTINDRVLERARASGRLTSVTDLPVCRRYLAVHVNLAFF